MTKCKRKKEVLIGLFSVGALTVGEIIDKCFSFSIEKACEYLEENPPMRFDDIQNYVEQFKKAMEK